MTPGSPVAPSAEPFEYAGGPIGALMLHGFTGSPAALRPFGDYLAERGLTVSCPLFPGHGTRWEDLATTSWRDWEEEAELALTDIAGRCSRVVAVGLSFGGTMALHLGTILPERLCGVVAVNPYVRDPRLHAASFLRLFLRSRKGVGNDIKKPEQDEVAYPRMPFAGLAQLGRFIRRVEKELPRMRLPFLLFNSIDDHVVPKGTKERVMARVGSADKQGVVLRNSYHVATLDNDAEAIFERTLAFARARAASAVGSA